MAGTMPRVSINPRATPGTLEEGVAAGLATADPPPDPVLEALPARVVADARRVVAAGAALAGVEAGAGVLDTGFTSTVLFAAAVLRVVRRRGVGEGVEFLHELHFGEVELLEEPDGRRVRFVDLRLEHPEPKLLPGVRHQQPDRFPCNASQQKTEARLTFTTLMDF